MKSRNTIDLKSDPIFLLGLTVARLEKDFDPEVQDLGKRLDTLIREFFKTHPMDKAE